MNKKRKMPAPGWNGDESALPPGIYHRKRDGRFSVNVYTKPGGPLYVGSFSDADVLKALARATDALHHAHHRLARWITSRVSRRYTGAAAPEGPCPGTILAREEMLLTGKVPERDAKTGSKLAQVEARLFNLEARVSGLEANNSSEPAPAYVPDKHKPKKK